MKIHFEHKNTIFEIERKPTPPERFTALCKLAGATIGGVVLVALVHMLDVWGLLWSLVGLVLVGVYKLIRGGFMD